MLNNHYIYIKKLDHMKTTKVSKEEQARKFKELKASIQIESSEIDRRIRDEIDNFFDYQGYEIITKTDKHYRNREINNSLLIYDVQIGWKSANNKMRDIKNLTIVIQG